MRSKSASVRAQLAPFGTYYTLWLTLEFKIQWENNDNNSGKEHRTSNKNIYADTIWTGVT